MPLGFVGFQRIFLGCGWGILVVLRAEVLAIGVGGMLADKRFSGVGHIKVGAYVVRCICRNEVHCVTCTQRCYTSLGKCRNCM